MKSYSRDGLVFDVSEWGPDDGRAVIALHGFPEDRHAWDELAPPLAEAGYRVLAADQRGYAAGAQPHGRREYRLELLAGDVLALADAAGAQTFDLVAHDWGAVAAWYLAAKRPDRVRSLTALSVPHPQAFASAMLRSSQGIHSWYFAFFQLPWLPEKILGARGGALFRSSLVRSGVDQERAERYAARAARPGGMTGPINWYRALPFGARDRVGPVSISTLFVWGAADPFVTSKAAELCASQVTGPYRFVTLEGHAHWLPTTAAPTIAPLLLEHLLSTAPGAAETV